jgi:hypothetical protein
LTGKDASEHLESGFGLVVWDLMTGLVNAKEAEVAVLTDLAVLLAVDDERSIAGSSKFGSVVVVHRKRDGFAAEPIANVIRVSVVQGNSNALVEEVF